MPLAVLQNGEIRPLEALPGDWQEGQRLCVEVADEGEATVEEIDRDFALLASLCADSDPAEEEQLGQALTLIHADRESDSPVFLISVDQRRSV